MESMVYLSLGLKSVMLVEQSLSGAGIIPNGVVGDQEPVPDLSQPGVDLWVTEGRVRRREFTLAVQ